MRTLLSGSLCLLFITLGAPSKIQAEDQLADRVRKSIDKGVEYLKSMQRDQGNGRWNWENSNIAALQPGGNTCLVTLALLTAGVPANDPVIKRALPYIRGIAPQHVYVVSLQTMVLAELNDPKDLNQIQKNVDWLINAAVTTKGKLGAGGRLEGWTYTSGVETRHGDGSNSQYAILGLYAGKMAGAKIDTKVWEAIREHYVRTQGANQKLAGWAYGREGDATHTMTCAGVCGLLIAAMELTDNVQELDEKTGIAKKCGFYPDDDALARGLRWLAANFVFRNTPHTFYNVYGIERVGRLSGRRFIGEHDWYREGCELLVGYNAEGKRVNSDLNQKPGGQWEMKEGLDTLPQTSTAFALLFLAKGRMPILISKFAWDRLEDKPGANLGWNRKHSDARHIVDYCSRELFKKMPLTWQAFDPRLSDLSDEKKFKEELENLLQSPILYITGHEAPNLTAAQKKLLRRYVDEGGFILAEACCGSPEFSKGFQKLLRDKECFGDDGLLLPLDPKHAIWSAHKLIPASIFQGDQVPLDKKILSLERGCKTVAVLIQTPLAGYWEEARFIPKPNDVVDETNRPRLAFQLAGNIVAYATGLEPPQPKLKKPKLIDTGDDLTTVVRFSIELAQVKHDGGDWQPAPRAIRSLASYMRDKYKLDVALNKQDLSLNSPKLFDYKFLYMHGRTRFTMDANELENLRSHFETGGMLFADACCGKKEFDEAFRDMVKKLYPDKKLEIIPEDDLLYSEKLTGEAIRMVRCRTEKEDGSANDKFVEIKPQLEGLKIDGRWVIIYSRYDIGCALEKNKSSACLGYHPDDAARLAAAALMYSLRK